MRVLPRQVFEKVGAVYDEKDDIIFGQINVQNNRGVLSSSVVGDSKQVNWPVVKVYGKASDRALWE